MIEAARCASAIEEGLLAAAEAFERARAAGAGVEMDLRLAGLRVRLRIAGARLAGVALEALGHRGAFTTQDASISDVASRGETADLVLDWIDLADPAATAAPLGALRALFGGGARVVRVPSPDPLAPARRLAGLEPETGSLDLLDAPSGRAARFSGADLPSWVAAAPLRTLLGWWLAAEGRLSVHGAGIGTRDASVLLAAPGGSGKSTVTAACLATPPGARGGDLLVTGDDFTVVTPGGAGGAPSLGSLYATAKLARDHASRFPALTPAIAREGPLHDPADKAVLRLRSPGLATRLADGLPLRALLVPSLGLDRPESRVVPSTRAEALRALAPTTVVLLQGVERPLFAALADLVRALPCARLLVGRDVGGVAPVLRGVVERLERGEAPVAA